MNTLGIRLATSRLLGRLGDNNTMAENVMILLIALAAFALLLLSQRLGLSGLSKKLLMAAVYILIAVILVLQIFVFS